jgi:hypothetical protein
MPQLDFPFGDAAAEAAAHFRAGHTVHQKFTCGRCGTRQTMAEPNRFFTSGKCEECGHVTDLVVRGCGYLLVTRVSPAH